MLVLTRKLGEAVCIGQDVEIYVVGVSRGRVKLGFRAPRDVPVQRSEVAERIAVPQSVGPASRPAMVLSEHADLRGIGPLSAFRRVGGI